MDIFTTSDWIQLVSTAILVVSIIIAYYFSSKMLKEIKDQMWISIFSEYTRRYSEIIRDLPDAASDPQISALNKASRHEKDKIMGLMRAYFDLCSEEYYLHKTGKIDRKTWSLWEKGLVFTARLPTFVDAWKLIKVEGYDEAFVEYIDKLISRTSKELRGKGDDEMADVFFKRLGLFQGVLIGIYGSWLISFLDKFTLSEETSLWTIVLLILVFITFLMYFALCWLSSKPKSISLLSGALHSMFVFLVTLLEWMTRPVSIWFILIGQAIFWLLVAFVVTTSEYEEKFLK